MEILEHLPYVICSQSALFVFLTSILWIPALISYVLFENRKWKVMEILENLWYAICSLPKAPWQTVQTQIRLLLKKQSDQDLLCLLTGILWIPALITNIFWEQKEKCLNFITFTICDISWCPAKSTSWQVYPSKTQIRLWICAVWSVFDWCSMGSQGSNVSLGRKLRLITLCGFTGWFKFLLYTHANLYLMLDTSSFVVFHCRVIKWCG